MPPNLLTMVSTGSWKKAANSVPSSRAAMLGAGNEHCNAVCEPHHHRPRNEANCRSHAGQSKNDQNDACHQGAEKQTFDAVICDDAGYHHNERAGGEWRRPWQEGVQPSLRSHRQSDRLGISFYRNRPDIRLIWGAMDSCTGFIVFPNAVTQ